MSGDLGVQLGSDEISAHYLTPWCTEEDLPQNFLREVTDVDLGTVAAAASNLLYILSGRQYRTGRSIIRPTSIQSSYGTQSYLYPYSSMSGYGSAWGFAAGWSWTAVGMGWWQNGQDLSECVLQGPVRSINNVIVNGDSLGPWPPANANYTLYDRRRLVRNVNQGDPGATAAWPWNQQLQLSPDQPGTWLIDYTWGRNPGPLGKLAAVELTTQIAYAVSKSDNITRSKLPARVLQIASQGVTAAIGDPLSYIREDFTGLPVVDMFLNAVNPAKLRRRSIFIAPNSVQGREQNAYPVA